MTTAAKLVIWHALVRRAFALYTGFSSLSFSVQIKFIVLLPVIKLVEKNLLSKVLGDRNDIKPELVIFSVKVFNALFVSCCMQSSTSFDTNLAIMGLDFLQACVSLHDLNTLLVDVNALAVKIQMKKGTAVATAIEMSAPSATALRNLDRVSTSFNWSWSMSLRGLGQVAPMVGVVNIISPQEQLSFKSYKIQELGSSSPPPGLAATANTAALSAHERLEFQNKTLQIMFLIKFVLLVKFTEIMIPVVYDEMARLHLLIDTPAPGLSNILLSL